MDRNTPPSNNNNNSNNYSSSSHHHHHGGSYNRRDYDRYDNYYHDRRDSYYNDGYNSYSSNRGGGSSGYREHHNNRTPPPSSRSSSGYKEQDGGDSSPPRSPTSSSQTSKIREMSYLERVSIFKKMLDDCKVQIDDDWSRAMKRVGNDSRVKIISRIQDRKDIFQQYISEKINREREMKREKRRKLREDFLSMLAELKSTPIFSQPKAYLSTTYQQVLPKIENDHRFLNVESEDDRLDYFYSFLDELENKDKDISKLEKRERKTRFKELLVRKKEQGLISYRTLWRQIREKIQSEEEYKALDYCDRLLVWEEFISNLELEHYNKKKHRREERERLIKQQGDNYWGLLSELRRGGKINVLSSWKEVKPILENEDRYQAIANQIVDMPSSSPMRYQEQRQRSTIEKARAIFNDYIDHLLSIYKQDKKTFRKLLKDLDLVIDDNSNFEEFKSKLEKDERVLSIGPDNISILFEEAVDKAKDKKRKYQPTTSEELTNQESNDFKYRKVEGSDEMNDHRP